MVHATGWQSNEIRTESCNKAPKKRVLRAANGKGARKITVSMRMKSEKTTGTVCFVNLHSETVSIFANIMRSYSMCILLFFSLFLTVESFSFSFNLDFHSCAQWAQWVFAFDKTYDVVHGCRV